MKISEEQTKTKWVIDPAHSEIGFKVKHLMIANVRGFFKEFDANIYTIGENYSHAEIEISIFASSIYTGDEKRDAHLKSADFFDVEIFNKINFISDTFRNVENSGKYELYGNLIIKNVTRRIKLDVEFGGEMKDPWGNVKAIFTVNGKIDRREWGLNWNAALETGGILVSEEVWINCEIELTKQL
jgi:polyisoprenoid-binding protein YceI